MGRDLGWIQASQNEHFQFRSTGLSRANIPDNAGVVFEGPVDVIMNTKTILPSSGRRKHYRINHFNTVNNNHTIKSACQLH